ncbi:MAG: hypothetical protein V4714_20675, partial [Bacteroidota bacterium]
AVTAGAAGPTNKDDCEVCKEKSKPVCEAIEQLRNKALRAAMPKLDADRAVNKLCVAIAAPATLLAIATKLNATSFTDADVKSFLGDVIQSPCNDYNLCSHLSKLTANRVEGWKIIQEGMESPTLNSTLAKNFEIILDATACYEFAPSGRGALVTAIRTKKMSIKEFLTELSAIAEANQNDEIINKYSESGNKQDAYVYYRDKGSCANMAIPPSLVGNPNQASALVGYQNTRKQAQVAYRENPTKANKKLIIDASEQAALASSDEYFRSQGYRKLECELSGNSKQGQFDQVYAKGDGAATEVIVVECKGGVSPLGCRKNNQQGTKEYFEDILLNMQNLIRDRNPGNGSDIRSTIRIINTARSLNKLSYYELRQPFDNDGKLQNTKISKFQIVW